MRKEENATKLETKVLFGCPQFSENSRLSLNKRYELWYNLR